MRRFVFAALAVALVAFAPAPFPKANRHEPPGITLQRFQGKWKAVKLVNVGKNLERTGIEWGVSHIHVEGDLWTFYMTGDVKNNSYVLVIDPSRRPATIDFYSGNQRQDGVAPYMLGLIKREGNVVTILYFTATADQRATSFENPPPGWWLLTLEKMG
jgi:uncharacterized protein (TIGR03067 family)